MSEGEPSKGRTWQNLRIEQFSADLAGATPPPTLALRNDQKDGSYAVSSQDRKGLVRNARAKHRRMTQLPDPIMEDSPVQWSVATQQSRNCGGGDGGRVLTGNSYCAA
ncbi:hypothetical protein B0H13DRAFT_1860707 [Mycena leptocephala]|nr:hypothetical protein B0H13DRAFT_1860707 [Mycena leptocephala]